MPKPTQLVLPLGQPKLTLGRHFYLNLSPKPTPPSSAENFTLIFYKEGVVPTPFKLEIFTQNHNLDDHIQFECNNSSIIKGKLCMVFKYHNKVHGIDVVEDCQVYMDTTTEFEESK